MAPAFKRILLKLSGEALMGELDFGTDPARVAAVARQVAAVHDQGVEVGIVVGAGNIYRGMKGAAAGMDRSTADYMGMLATVLNALPLQDALEKSGTDTRVQSALAISEVAEPYIRRRAMRHLEKGRVVIFAAGTGNPFFTTDTAAALRAAEVHAEIILMAKNGVQGVYTADPALDPGARFLPEITHMEALERRLRVMDSTALALCMENGMPLNVFNMDDESNISRIISGERVGTLVSTTPSEQEEAAVAEMIDELIEDGRVRMAKSVEATQHELATVRTGRASPALLERVVVDYYGAPTPLNQLATISAPEARLLTVQPYDKSSIKAIEKAINESDVGLNPSNDGSLVRLVVPELTEERRRELVKVVRHLIEEGRVKIRNVRRDVMHDLRELKEAGEAGSDDEHRAEVELQKLTDARIADLDGVLKAKEEEILEV